MYRLDLEPAPWSRRGGAFFLDGLIAFALCTCVLAVLGYVLPPDHLLAFGSCLVVALLVSASYLALGPAIFGNLLGKRLFSLIVVSVPPGPISLGRWLLRAVGSLLWPLNAVMAVFGPSGRHVADQMAETRVVVVPAARSLPLSLAILAVMTYALLQLTHLCLRATVINSSAWHAAKAAVKGEDAPLLPAAFEIDDGLAQFYFQSGGQHHLVSLLRRGEDWQVVASQPIEAEDVPDEASISFGTPHEKEQRFRFAEHVRANLSERSGAEVSVECPEGVLDGGVECRLGAPYAKLRVPVVRDGDELRMRFDDLVFGRELERQAAATWVEAGNSAREFKCEKALYRRTLGEEIACPTPGGSPPMVAFFTVNASDFGLKIRPSP